MAAAKSLTPVELDRVLAYTATQPYAQRNRAMLLMTVSAGLRVLDDFCRLSAAGVCGADCCGSVSWRGCSDATPKRLARASQELCNIDFSRGCSAEGGGLSDSLGWVSDSGGKSDGAVVASAGGATRSLLVLAAESLLVAFFERGA